MNLGTQITVSTVTLSIYSMLYVVFFSGMSELETTYNSG